MSRVGFTTRTLASLLDAVLITILGGAACFLLIRYGQNIIEAIHSDPKKNLVIIIQSSWILVSTLYIFLEVIFNASPGKMIFGLYIGNINGDPTSFLHRIWRILCKYPIMITGFIFILGFVCLPVSTKLGASIFLFSLSTLPIVGIASTIISLGYFMALSYSRETLHDRLSNTGIFYGPIPDNSRPTTKQFQKSRATNQPTANCEAANKLLFK